MFLSSSLTLSHYDVEEAFKYWKETDYDPSLDLLFLLLYNELSNSLDFFLG